MTETVAIPTVVILFVGACYDAKVSKKEHLIQGTLKNTSKGTAKQNLCRDYQSMVFLFGWIKTKKETMLIKAHGFSSFLDLYNN